MENNMDHQDVKVKLDALAELQAQRDSIMLEKNRLLDSLYTDEIKFKMSEVETEFAPKTDTVNEKIATLEQEVRHDVLELDTSVKGTVLHAIVSKGRVSWDTKAIDGYAVAHPEILQFKTEGAPSASIRVAK